MSSITASQFQQAVGEITDQIKHEMERRSVLAANELRSSALEVLRGQRSGRVYTVPGSKAKYRASAPGEPPAARTGNFRLSWQPASKVVFGSYISRIESDLRTENGKYTLGQILEDGTSRMASRPYQDRVLEHSEPSILKIYNQPYF